MSEAQQPKRTRRQPRRLGDVVAIPLSDGRHGFGLVLNEPLTAFHECISAPPFPELAEIAASPVAFRIWVAKPAIMFWPIIGHIAVPDALLEPPLFCKRDAITGRLSITEGGFSERPASTEECVGLEAAAVWSASARCGAARRPLCGTAEQVSREHEGSVRQRGAELVHLAQLVPGTRGPHDRVLEALGVADAQLRTDAAQEARKGDEVVNDMRVMVAGC